MGSRAGAGKSERTEAGHTRRAIASFSGLADAIAASDGQQIVLRASPFAVGVPAADETRWIAEQFV
jgi:hypothetical protein